VILPLKLQLEKSFISAYAKRQETQQDKNINRYKFKLDSKFHGLIKIEA